MEDLTPRQKQVYEFIKAYIKLKGCSPSYSAISQGLNLKSKAHIHRVIHRIRKKGYLVVRPHKASGVRLVDKSVMDMSYL